ncbi:MAG: AraC family transcriptional regulator ligand-binding domain-containing protein [Spongiibacteraceae bacterium]
MNGFDALTVSVATVSALLEGVGGVAARQALLQRAGVASSALLRPGARLPVQQFVCLCRLLSGALNDEWYGLLERPQRLGTYRAMAINAVNAVTLGGAINRYIELNNLFENSLVYHCEIDSAQVCIAVSRRPGMRVRNNFAVDSALMIVHRFSGWLINERIALAQVLTDYQSQLGVSEQQKLFYGATVLSGQAVNSLRFSAEYFDRPVLQSESTLEDYLCRAPLNLYLPLSAHGHYAQRVRSILLRDYRQGGQAVGLVAVAARLSLHPQALRRQLRMEGVSFRSIKSRLLQDLAVHFLSATDQSVADVAERMGYAEPGAFIRAFKHWAGITPLAFRKSLKD